MRVFVVGGQREEFDRAAGGPAQLLHPEDAAGHRPWRARRAQPHVRRPLGLPLQERSVLFQWLRPHGEAARGQDSDRRVMFFRGLFTLFLIVAVAAPAAAQEKQPPYWASIASGQALTHTGPGKTYPNVWLYQRRDLPVRVVKKYETWRLIQDPDGAQGWMLVTLLSDRRTAIVRPGDPRPVRVNPSDSAKVLYQVEHGVVRRIRKSRAGGSRM